MKLYHGTWESNFKKILESSKLLCNYYSSETTELLNEIIEEYLGEDLCSGCVYLSGDVEATEAYDYVVIVDTDDLNTRLLYVADNRLKDQILYEYHRNTSEDEKKARLKHLVKEYAKSFITFKDYMEIKESYDKEHYPEFLYFGDIPIKSDGEKAYSTGRR